MIYFSIHDIVGIEVDEKYKWSETLIPNIPMFKADKNKFEKIKTRISITYKEKVILNDAYEVVADIFINRNTNQFLDKKYGAIISKINDDFYTITCNQECNEWLMMLLEYLLLKNKATFIHSAGVEKNGNAYIFPSWGGVGKTASVAKLIRENDYKLLGDDLVILKEDGTVLAFPKKFVLYEYHRKLFGDVMKDKRLITGKLSKIASHIIPFVKGILRHIPFVLSWARRHNPQSKRVSPYNIFGEDKISCCGTLRKCTWLERIEVDKTKSIEVDSYTLASKSLMITIHELFENRLEVFAIALCAECFDYKILFDDSIEFVNKIIKNVKRNQLFIPIKYSIENVAADVVEHTNE